MKKVARLLPLLLLTACPAGSGADSGGDDGAEHEPLDGIADLHLHMFGEDAFGGGWFHGTARGPGEIALAPCDGGTPGDHAWLRDDLEPLLGECENLTLDELAEQVPLVDAVLNGGGSLVSEAISFIPGSEGDTGTHALQTDGWPDLESWPRWDAIAHQQSWEGHLLQAYEDGLRIEVVSAVTFDFLCRAIREDNLERPDCNEMDDIRVQLMAANTFAEETEWAEIALSADHARQIIEDDKLAIVLSVEASHIMADGDWRPQLEELYDLGVRTLQPVHQLDNRFGGAAPHNYIFQLAMYTENCHIDTDCALTSDEVTLGFDVDSECKNTLGLTDEGEELIEEMMDRGMLIDAAHLSEKSVADLQVLAERHEYYPVYLSHAHFREIMRPEKQVEEKTTPAWVVQMVRETGGMIGLRTGHEETNTYDPSDVDNTCHGSSRSFAQAYDYGRLGLKVAIGLGTDFNGFIQQTRPRFGRDACSAVLAESSCQAMLEETSGPGRLGSDFDEAGLGHVGLIGALLDDLDALGSDTDPLRTSANDFVLMWERAEGERSGPAADVSDLDTDGITVLPPADMRPLPPECQ